VLSDHTNTMGERMHQPVRAKFRTAIALTALTAALATAAPAIVAPPANAQLWMRTSCINPDQSAAPSDGWTGGATGTVSIGSTNNTNCTSTLPMYAALSMQSAAPSGASEYLAYTPPTGSTLVGGSLLVGLAANGYGYRAVATAAMFTPAYQYDASSLFLQCVAVLAACQNGLPEYYGIVNLPTNKGGNLYLGAGCTGQMAGTYCTNGGSRGVWSSVAVASANLLLSSSSMPTASDFAGSLLTPGAHGTSALTFTAADTGPGVYRATVTVDGAVVYSETPNTNAGKCVPVGSDPVSGALMWDWQQPCPPSQTVVVPVDTSTMTDGEHALKVTLQSAAGNVSTVRAQTITTSNLTTISGKLTSDAPAAPEPQYAIVLDAPTQALMRGVRSAFRRSSLTLSGTLRNSAGVPAPGVTVSLTALNGHQGDGIVVAQTTTDPAGHWVLAAPRGPSRTLSITYGSGSKGAISIKQTVSPTVTLTVRPLGGARLRFRGRLRIAPLGSPLPLVVIQARNGRRWQNLGRNVRVTPSGRFTMTYKGPRAKPPLGILGASFEFRAVAPATRLFTTGISPIRRTVVR
jgi:hypothetical protein